MLPANKNIRARLRSVLAFLMHQLVATEGVIWLTILSLLVLRSTISAVHQPWGSSSFMRVTHFLLSNNPFFPVQIAAGAVLGWKLQLRWQHKSMFWVWILPGALLAYAVLVIPTLSPWSLAPQTSAFSHYFGWGCRAEDRCYDQLTLTQPFYISLAYSISAFVASKKMKVNLANAEVQVARHRHRHES